jgi:hypothetical protein
MDETLEGTMAADLLTEVVEATGLPADWAKSELTKLLVDSGFNPEMLTLDMLREVLAQHIGEALLKAKEESILLESSKI